MRARALLLVLLLGAACPGVRQPLEQPVITVESVARRGDRALVALRVTNPNRAALHLRAVDSHLTMGTAAVRERAPLDVLVPAGGAAAAAFELQLPAVAPAVYELRAVLHFFTGDRALAVVTDDTGSL
jgi:hypothetical protein